MAPTAASPLAPTEGPVLRSGSADFAFRLKLINFAPMFRLSKISFFAAAVLLLFACSPGKIDPEPGPEPEDVRSITVGAESISAVGAVMKGKAEINTESGSVMFGFQYCTLDGSTTSPVLTVLSNDVDKNYNYSASLSSLEPNTTYKFWSFVRQNGKDSYGEPKEFTTKDISSVISTLEVSAASVDGTTLKAGLDLTDVQFSNIKYGFCWGNSESSLNKRLDGSEITQNTYSALLGGLLYNTKYFFRPYVTLDDRKFYGEVKDFTTEVFKISAVDLGLSVKWANANLGANYPDDYGDYYAYGETEPYYAEGHSQDNPCKDWRAMEGRTITGYDWKSYKWTNLEWNKLTKYCPADQAEFWDGEGGPDDKTVLDAEDDAAAVKLGGKWRMPTYEEWEELFKKCSWTWVNYYGSGKSGYVIESSNGNSIFLPTSGSRNLTTLSFLKAEGVYRSSSLRVIDPSTAHTMRIKSDIREYNNDDSRYIGYPIRPVTE